MRSGAVRGDFTAIDVLHRRGTAVLAVNSTHAVVAQHGYLLEMPCTTAAACQQLYVRVSPDALSKYTTNTTFALGWAFYETNGTAAPSPPAAAAPKLSDVLHDTVDVVTLIICGIALIAALSYAVLVKPRRSVPMQPAPGTQDAKPAEIQTVGKEEGEDKKEEVRFVGRRRMLRAL